MRLDTVQKKLGKINSYSKNLYLKKYYKKILKLLYKNKLDLIIDRYKIRNISVEDLNDLDKMIKIGKLMYQLEKIIKNKKEKDIK